MTGLDNETFSMKQGNNPGDVLTSINERHEIDAGINFKIAVNDEFSDWDIELNDGDRLVFIPPVTGG
jgi:Molybdopterin converting factor, small subunit